MTLPRAVRYFSRHSARRRDRLVLSLRASRQLRPRWISGRRHRPVAQVEGCLFPATNRARYSLWGGPVREIEASRGEHERSDPAQLISFVGHDGTFPSPAARCSPRSADASQKSARPVPGSSCQCTSPREPLRCDCNFWDCYQTARKWRPRARRVGPGFAAGPTRPSSKSHARRHALIHKRRAVCAPVPSSSSQLACPTCAIAVDKLHTWPAQGTAVPDRLASLLDLEELDRVAERTVATMKRIVGVWR